MLPRVGKNTWTNNSWLDFWTDKYSPIDEKLSIDEYSPITTNGLTADHRSGRTSIVLLLSISSNVLQKKWGTSGVFKLVSLNTKTKAAHTHQQRWWSATPPPTIQIQWADGGQSSPPRWAVGTPIPCTVGSDQFSGIDLGQQALPTTATTNNALLIVALVRKPVAAKIPPLKHCQQPPHWELRCPHWSWFPNPLPSTCLSPVTILSPQSTTIVHLCAKCPKRGEDSRYAYCI